MEHFDHKLSVVGALSQPFLPQPPLGGLQRTGRHACTHWPLWPVNTVSIPLSSRATLVCWEAALGWRAASSSGGSSDGGPLHVAMLRS